MLIQILIDNSESWILPYAEELTHKIREMGHESRLVFESKKVVKGDILCLLACEKLFKDLKLNKHNLVVHESDLPQGKGWSPLTWQILEGKKEIPVTLFEAEDMVDAGKIYNKEIIFLKGTELLPEIKHKQGLATQNLILTFIKQYPMVKGYDQIGESTFYPRRGIEDSAINPFKSLAEQFDLLRVCDNERYPAFFRLYGKKYVLKITSEDE